MPKGNRGGSKTTNIAITAQTVNQLSQAQLNKLDKNYIQQENLISNRLSTIASSNPAYDMPQEYYDIKKEQQAVQAEHRIITREIAKRKKRTEKTTQKTFVNSYGEATTREITTATYKRAQKRARKQIENIMSFNRR